ncbi:MAG: glycosyltransferase family 2 protein [Carboxydocellales bacterium]
MLSIIIPTFNEQSNVFAITNGICQAMEGEDFELIFVDDSTDETPEFLGQINRKNPRVSYIHRTGVRGLATAVTTGFRMAKGNTITVMDADLQHPPEMLPHLLAKIKVGHDLVIPSRFIPGGDDGGLSLFRKIISRTARGLAWLALKKSRATTDPMSGFFMFRKHILDGAELNPVGWKILLEVLAKGNFHNVAEIPYRFQPRAGDQSKMSLMEQKNYLHHLFRLVTQSPEDSRFWKFCLVGFSGVVVNLSIYTCLVIVLRANVVLSGVLSAFIAMFSNFILNDRFTWKNNSCQPIWVRLSKFYVYCSIGIFINSSVLTILYGYAHLNYLLANLLGITTATAWNFTANQRWTWGRPEDDLVPDDLG